LQLDSFLQRFSELTEFKELRVTKKGVSVGSFFYRVGYGLRNYSVEGRRTSPMLKRYSLFAGGSAMGAAIDYSLTLAASVLVNLGPTIALGLAMIVSASIIIFFHDRITFHDVRDNVRDRFFLFMLWACLIFLMRTLLLKVSPSAGLPLAVAVILAIGLASVINFSVSSPAIFAKKQP
jgi:putative flippase GtrA